MPERHHLHHRDILATLQCLQHDLYQQLLPCGPDPGHFSPGQRELYLYTNLQLSRVRPVQRIQSYGTSYRAGLLKAPMNSPYRSFLLELSRIAGLLRRLVTASDGTETIELPLRRSRSSSFCWGSSSSRDFTGPIPNCNMPPKRRRVAQPSTAVPAGPRRAAGAPATRVFRTSLPASCSGCLSRAATCLIFR